MKLEISMCNTQNTTVKKRLSEIEERTCDDITHILMIQEVDLSSMKEHLYPTNNKEIVSMKKHQMEGLFYVHSNIKHPYKYEGILVYASASERSKVRFLYKKINGISKAVIFCFLTIDKSSVLIAVLPTTLCNGYDKDIRELITFLDTEKEEDGHVWEWMILGYPPLIVNSFLALEHVQQANRHIGYALPYIISSNNLKNTNCSCIIFNLDIVHNKISLETNKG